MEQNSDLPIRCHICRWWDIHESHLELLELALEVVHVYRVRICVIGAIEIERLWACVDRPLGLTDRSDTLGLGGEKPKGGGEDSTSLHRVKFIERSAQVRGSCVLAGGTRRLLSRSVAPSSTTI